MEKLKSLSYCLLSAPSQLEGRARTAQHAVKVTQNTQTTEAPFIYNFVNFLVALQVRQTKTTLR